MRGIEILSATLPKDADIRDTLIAKLRRGRIVKKRTPSFRKCCNFYLGKFCLLCVKSNYEKGTRCITLFLGVYVGLCRLERHVE